jgi:4-hydroxybenzoate polyprenyltransferase
MKLSVALRLGRVSNLPTVLSNVLAGLTLSGGTLAGGGIATLCAAMSCMYVGGMFLNDAFDREHDRRERRERPIPAGQVSAAAVFAWGFALLAAGIALTAGLAFGTREGLGLPPVAAMCALALVIVIYDAYHKQNPLSPLVMAANRVLVYVVTALSASVSLAPELLGGAGTLACYVIGLSYAAKQENAGVLRRTWPLVLLCVPFLYLPSAVSVHAQAAGAALVAFTAYNVLLLVSARHRDIKRAVGQLIAGIALLDALLVAIHGRPDLALACTLCWLATLGLQRFVPGT